MKYEVFARVKAGGDLVHQGNLEADTDRLARIYARRTYDEEDWDRLVVVRRAHLLEVTDEGARPDGPRSGAEGDA